MYKNTFVKCSYIKHFSSWIWIWWISPYFLLQLCFYLNSFQPYCSVLLSSPLSISTPLPPFQFLFLFISVFSFLPCPSQGRLYGVMQFHRQLHLTSCLTKMLSPPLCLPRLPSIYIYRAAAVSCSLSPMSDCTTNYPFDW